MNKKIKKINKEVNEFLLYTSPKGDVKVEVLLNEETIWLKILPPRWALVLIGAIL